MGTSGGEYCAAPRSYLLPAQFVATEKPFAVRSLAIPMPISPIDRMPTVASLAEAIVMLFRMLLAYLVFIN